MPVGYFRVTQAFYKVDRLRQCLDEYVQRGVLKSKVLDPVKGIYTFTVDHPDFEETDAPVEYELVFDEVFDIDTPSADVSTPRIKELRHWITPNSTRAVKDYA